MSAGLANIISGLAYSLPGPDGNTPKTPDIPDFRSGDTVRVHARIVEGSKERIQVFEGIVIKRHKRRQRSATFTVRKVSYNVGVERTFFLHSPRIEKIEVVNRGVVRRARLYYLRNVFGKAGKIKTQYETDKPKADSAKEARV